MITYFHISGILDSSAIHTAIFVEEVNNLFDSFNGVAKPYEVHKYECQNFKLRCRMTDKTDHILFWNYVKDKVRKWAFLKHQDDLESASSPPKMYTRRPPSQDGWLTSINAMETVWKAVKEVGFTSLETRALNQDSLENTFGVIRMSCGSNAYPSAAQFSDALKTGIINGLAYRGHNRGNCEDDGASLLDNLQTLLLDQQQPRSTSSQSVGTEVTDISDRILHVVEQVESDFNAENMEIMSTAYVSGFIARNLLRKSECNSCKNCLMAQLGEEYSPRNAFILFKDRSSSTEHVLTFPSEKLVRTVGTAATLIENILDTEAHKQGIEASIILAVRSNIDFEWLSDTLPGIARCYHNKCSENNNSLVV